MKTLPGFAGVIACALWLCGSACPAPDCTTPKDQVLQKDAELKAAWKDAEDAFLNARRPVATWCIEKWLPEVDKYIAAVKAKKDQEANRPKPDRGRGEYTAAQKEKYDKWHSEAITLEEKRKRLDESLDPLLDELGTWKDRQTNHGGRDGVMDQVEQMVDGLPNAVEAKAAIRKLEYTMADGRRVCQDVEEGRPRSKDRLLKKAWDAREARKKAADALHNFTMACGSRVELAELRREVEQAKLASLRGGDGTPQTQADLEDQGRGAEMRGAPRVPNPNQGEPGKGNSGDREKYTVVSGDTLGEIATRLAGQFNNPPIWGEGGLVKMLFRNMTQQNPSGDPNRIFPGDIIDVTAAKEDLQVS